MPAKDMTVRQPQVKNIPLNRSASGQLGDPEQTENVQGFVEKPGQEENCQ